MNSEVSLSKVIALTAACAITWRAVNAFISRKYLSNIPGPTPDSWFKGHLMNFFGPDAWGFHLKLFREYGGVARLDMLFGERQLFVTDPLSLYHILLKGQDSYEEADQVLILFGLIFGPSLLSTVGDRHSKQRKMLNPVFSVKHMRQLLPMSYPIAHKLCDVLREEIEKGIDDVDILNWVGRAALEAVGKAGFGHSFDALNESKPTDEYSEALAGFFPAMSRLTFLRQFLGLSRYGPAKLRRLLLELLPSKNVKEIVSITDTIERNSKRILQERKQAIENGEDVLSGRGMDILSALMKENVDASGITVVPDEELLAHMSTFIFAGRDTTTSAMTQALYVLAHHPKEQAKLRKEVAAARKEHGDLDYDKLMGLPYLDSVCRECLRLYSPSTIVPRVCKKDNILPLLVPIKSTDGKSEVREILVRTGTFIYLSVLNANRNKSVWGEDADEWKPERWLNPLPKTVEEARMPSIYSHMMTFIGGKRACIGFKFAEMEMKMILSVLVEKFIFEPGPEIDWKYGPVPHPVVKHTGAEGQLPLRISLARKED